MLGLKDGWTRFSRSGSKDDGIHASYTLTYALTIFHQRKEVAEAKKEGLAKTLSYSKFQRELRRDVESPRCEKYVPRLAGNTGS